MKPILCTFLVLLGSCTLWGQNARTLFSEGVQAYTQAEHAEKENAARELYQKAAGIWQETLEHGHSAALHYNLGNAYARLNQPGLAVLHYEKALALNPHHAEALANLNYVRSALEMPAVEGYDAFHHEFSVDVWGWITALAFWVLVGAFILPRILSRPTALSRLIALLSFIAFAVGLYALGRLHFERTQGVILADETPLYIAPAKESEARGFAQAGTRAEFQKRHGEFYLVQTENGTTGWTDQKGFAPVWEP